MTILICDDDREIAAAISIYLQHEGYTALLAYDGRQALSALEQNEVHLIIMDVMMPEMDGLRATMEIRRERNIPLIMLSAKSEDTDKIMGLNMGADDYITKPFGLRELIARVKANIRRRGMTNVVGADPANVKEFGSITIDTNRYEARKNGAPLDLTLREFELVKYLAEREDKVYSREQLLEDVWGYEYYGDIRTVDVTVRRLREKLEDDSSNPKYVLTKRGVGYYFHRS